MVKTTKPAQVLSIDPSSEILFKGPFRDIVSTELHLHNGTDQTACYKVKTNAPQHYFVRPTSGLIAPGQTSTVTVMLQPFNNDPRDFSHHKFMVQSILVPNGPTDGVDKLWQRTRPDDVMESKIACVFNNQVSQSLSDGHIHEGLVKRHIGSDSSASPSTTHDTKVKDEATVSQSRRSPFTYIILLAILALIAYKCLI